MAITRSVSRCRTRSSKSGSYLPEELIFKILSWACVTSLLKCRSVCKLWLSIISKPKFIIAHHNNSLDKLPSSILGITSKFIEEEEESNDRHAAALIYSDTPENFINVPLISPFNDMEFISSCNGIVCVCNAPCNDIYLLNPLTKMFKRLPVPDELPFSHNDDEDPFRVDVVFGFDCVSRHYKVLRIVYSWTNYKLASGLAVDLYSFNTDSWRKIEFGDVLSRLVYYPHCAILRSGPVVDGVLYLEGINAIVTFHLDKEIFGLVPFPGFMHTRKSNIFDFQGSVAVVLESVRDGSLDADKEISLWAMEAVSDEVLWNKIFTFDTSFQIDWVFLYLGAKQFVGTTKLGTVLYDYSNKETKCIGLPSQSFLVTLLKHTESFLSVQGFEGVEET